MRIMDARKGALTAQVRRVSATTTWLADGEGLSALISLLYGNLQGIFAICREFGHLSLSEMPLDRRSTTEIPYAKNREFSVGNRGNWQVSSEIRPTRLAFDICALCGFRRCADEACEVHIMRYVPKWEPLSDAATRVMEAARVSKERGSSGYLPSHRRWRSPNSGR